MLNRNIHLFLIFPTLLSLVAILWTYGPFINMNKNSTLIFDAHYLPLGIDIQENSKTNEHRTVGIEIHGNTFRNRKKIVMEFHGKPQKGKKYQISPLVNATKYTSSNTEPKEDKEKVVVMAYVDMSESDDEGNYEYLEGHIRFLPKKSQEFYFEVSSLSFSIKGQAQI